MKRNVVVLERATSYHRYKYHPTSRFGPGLVRHALKHRPFHAWSCLFVSAPFPIWAAAYIFHPARLARTLTCLTSSVGSGPPVCWLSRLAIEVLCRGGRALIVCGTPPSRKPRRRRPS
ncbi:hypothetical protein BU26DRAFT_221668 [Trematosphaeria pertusa]|uniref:Uncharacterized protein n=1 Tax=Trematosphaeria pertusa TaxID=390896 RepID=A0A6A6ITC1_9PLEO|nr:uncharacterized protein BU26DRAFT_221668 [Trematosphaeria pertusa]KAF2253378.1 hypothetical protein BU26DRAFT_221668 [Trematosphaeria pertusa]